MILAYYGYGYYYFDPTYFLVIIGVIICALASAKVNSTYARYDQVRNHAGITGAMAAMADPPQMPVPALIRLLVFQLSPKAFPTMYCGFRIRPTVRHRLRHLELQHMNVDTRSSMQGIMYR